MTDPAGRAIGVIVVPILFGQNALDRSLTGISDRVLTVTAAIILAVIVMAIGLSRLMTRPIQILLQGTRRVAEGDLDFSLPERSSDELGRLVASFNQMTRDLKESQERLVRAEKEATWRDMAKQVAHEIKNPLTPMKLSAQHLVRVYERNPDSFASVLAKTTETIIQQIDVLSRIATEFGNFAKFPERNLVDVDLNELLRETIEVLRTPEDSRIRTIVDLAQDLPAVRLDRDEIKRVLINLVKNAYQAMEEKGSGRLHITTRSVSLPEMLEHHRFDRIEGDTRLELNEPGVRIDLNDSGCGIPEAYLAQIFIPSFSTKSQGSGLGLAMCKKSVTEMGGLIGVKSREGAGTTFSLLFRLDAEGATTRVRKILEQEKSRLDRR